jgi:predicted transcriptional regulator of viral defense system
MKSLAGIGKESRVRLAEIMRQTKGTITVQQTARILNLPATAASKLLARWANQGWLSRMRQGLYVPAQGQVYFHVISIKRLEEKLNQTS